MGVGAEQKVQTNPIVQAVKRKLERSDSAEEANYLLKCLNYPNIFHEDLSQPTTSTTSRSDSLASNIMRKLSVSGLAGLPQRSPGEMRRSARIIHDSLRTVKDYYNSYGLLLQASNATKQRSLFITIRESIPQGGQQHILHLIALSGSTGSIMGLMSYACNHWRVSQWSNWLTRIHNVLTIVFSSHHVTNG